MKFITFFTSQYKDCAKLLIEDAKRLKLELIAEELHDFADWQQATRFKAMFIERYMEHLDEDLCWIDADARIHKEPTMLLELSSKSYDIAAVYFKGNELLSGTLWLAHNSLVHATLKDWLKRNMDDKNTKLLEQRNLQDAIEEQKELRVLRLPPEYAYIFDLSKKIYPGVEPIIEHLQKSRAIRRKEKVKKILNITNISKPD